jgi:hypothetical protein
MGHLHLAELPDAVVGQPCKGASPILGIRSPLDALLPAGPVDPDSFRTIGSEVGMDVLGPPLGVNGA